MVMGKFSFPSRNMKVSPEEKTDYGVGHAKEGVPVLHQNASEKNQQSVNTEREIKDHMLKNRLASALVCLEMAMDTTEEMSQDAQEHVQEAKRQICSGLKMMAKESEDVDDVPPANLVRSVAAVVGPSVNVEVHGRCVAAVAVRPIKNLIMMVENAFQNALLHGENKSIKIKISMPTSTGLEGGKLKALCGDVIELVVSNKVKALDAEKTMMSRLPCSAQSSGKGLKHIEHLAEKSGIETHFSIEGGIARHTLRLPYDSFFIDEKLLHECSSEGEPTEEGLELGKPLLLGLEDSAVLRKGYNRVLLRKMLPWCSKDSVITGKDTAEVLGFASMVLEAKAGVIMLDDCLEYDDKRFSGIDVCRELRSKGFCNFICLRTGGEMSGYSEDVRAMFNMISSKDTPNEIFAKQLGDMYKSFQLKMNGRAK